jgi:hypothetical protein
MYHQCGFEHLGSGLAELLSVVFRNFSFVLKESIVQSILMVVFFSPSTSVVESSSLATKSVKKARSKKHQDYFNWLC